MALLSYCHQASWLGTATPPVKVKKRNVSREFFFMTQWYNNCPADVSSSFLLLSCTFSLYYVNVKHLQGTVCCDLVYINKTELNKLEPWILIFIILQISILLFFDWDAKLQVFTWIHEWKKKNQFPFLDVNSFPVLKFSYNLVINSICYLWNTW